VLQHLATLSSNQVAEKVVQLFRKHASEVGRVMDCAIANHASEIREGSLPPSCAIALAVAKPYRTENLPEKALSGKAPRPAVSRKPRRKQVDTAIEPVRERVRQMKREKMSASLMCKSLGTNPRPRGAAWEHLTWPEAWKSVHRNSVKAWLSKNSKPVT
jgi:hypothetical protein